MGLFGKNSPLNEITKLAFNSVTGGMGSAIADQIGIGQHIWGNSTKTNTNHYNLSDPDPLVWTDGSAFDGANDIKVNRPIYEGIQAKVKSENPELYKAYNSFKTRTGRDPKRSEWETMPGAEMYMAMPAVSKSGGTRSSTGGSNNYARQSGGNTSGGSPESNGNTLKHYYDTVKMFVKNKPLESTAIGAGAGYFILRMWQKSLPKSKRWKMFKSL